MKVFLESLLSRKLWLAIAALIVFVVNEQWLEAMGVVLGYFGINAVDTKLSQE